MDYRINTKVIAVVIALVLLAVALFVYTLVSAPADTEPVDTTETATQEDADTEIITAKHQYQDGVHTIAGKAEVPTPCHRLVTEPFFTQADSTNVEVRFSTLLEGEECPSQPFEVPFLVSFEAPEDVTISATWNGNAIRLNLVPVAPGETIDDELYIKG